MSPAGSPSETITQSNKVHNIHGVLNVVDYCSRVPIMFSSVTPVLVHSTFIVHRNMLARWTNCDFETAARFTGENAMCRDKSKAGCSWKSQAVGWTLGSDSQRYCQTALAPSVTKCVVLCILTLYIRSS